MKGPGLFFGSSRNPGNCGSELARDGGVSGGRDVGGDGPIASKLAPTIPGIA